MPADYVIKRGDIPKTPVERWNANIEAIKLYRVLERENRGATPDEQRVLAKYSGFGDSAFGQAFNAYTQDNAWERRRDELKDLVTKEEFDGIAESRTNAFYTSPEVVEAMWKGLSDMGADKLQDLKVLEPSAGSGRFLGLQPQGLAAKSKRTAVELDPMTAGILKNAYPETQVYNTGFENAPIGNDEYDIAISNVPFGDYGVYDPDFAATGRKRLTGSIHNYFFAKTLDKRTDRDRDTVVAERPANKKTEFAISPFRYRSGSASILERLTPAPRDSTSKASIDHAKPVTQESIDHRGKGKKKRN